MIENAVTDFLASLGMDKNRIEDYVTTIAGEEIAFPCYTMLDTFINTMEGNNLYAAGLCSGDMELYEKKKTKWERKKRRGALENFPTSEDSDRGGAAT